MVNPALSVVGGEMPWIMQFTLLAQSFWMKRVKYSCAFLQTSQQYCWRFVCKSAYIVRQRVAITSFLSAVKRGHKYYVKYSCRDKWREARGDLSAIRRSVSCQREWRREAHALRTMIGNNNWCGEWAGLRNRGIGEAHYTSIVGWSLIKAGVRQLINRQRD